VRLDSPADELSALRFPLPLLQDTPVRRRALSPTDQPSQLGRPARRDSGCSCSKLGAGPLTPADLRAHGRRPLPTGTILRAASAAADIRSPDRFRATGSRVELTLSGSDHAGRLTPSGPALARSSSDDSLLFTLSAFRSSALRFFSRFLRGLPPARQVLAGLGPAVPDLDPQIPRRHRGAGRPQFSFALLGSEFSHGELL